MSDLDFESGRPETGPMQFSADWTGVFIRGDDAFNYARSLEVLLDPKADEISLMIAKSVISGLIQNLNDSDQRNQCPHVQRMREFYLCSR